MQVHSVDAAGKTVITRQLRRGQVIGYFEQLPPCLVGMEACATAHHWARELTELGATSRPTSSDPSTRPLLPPQFVMLWRVPACGLCRSRRSISRPRSCCTDAGIC